MTPMVIEVESPLARVELRFGVRSVSLARALQARFDAERPPGSAIHVGLDGDGLAIRVEAVTTAMPEAWEVVIRGLRRPLRGETVRACLDRVPDAHEERVAETFFGTGDDCLTTAGGRMRRVHARLTQAPAAVVAVGTEIGDWFVGRPAWVASPRGALPAGCPVLPSEPGRSRVTAAWSSAGPEDALRDLILADGYSSRLTTRLRRSEGLVYDVEYARSGGFATATVEAEGPALPRVGAALCDELIRPVKAGEIEAARALAAALDRAAGDTVASAATRAWEGPPAEVPSPVPAGVAFVVTEQ